MCTSLLILVCNKKLYASCKLTYALRAYISFFFGFFECLLNLANFNKNLQGRKFVTRQLMKYKLCDSGVLIKKKVF